MFRSDSNSEDLGGFAGAGLFDSYSSHGLTEFFIEYSKDRLFNDAAFQKYLMTKIAEIGIAIENVYDG